MVVVRQGGCIRQSSCLRAKVFVFGQSGCIRAEIVVFGQKRLYSGKWLYSSKSVFIRAKKVVLWKKWLYSHNLAVFGQSGCI